MAEKQNPIRETDEQACKLARSLIDTAAHAALGVLGADGKPHVTRIAFTTAPSGAPLSLISDLSTHTKALRINPDCSLLIGDPAERGDPLTHPRITLSCTAKLMPHSDQNYASLRDHYLQKHPKAKLYIDFADFNFALFEMTGADLNGGFGKAFKLTAADLEL